jgi:hypothetical protein
MKTLLSRSLGLPLAPLGHVDPHMSILPPLEHVDQHAPLLFDPLGLPLPPSTHV